MFVRSLTELCFLLSCEQYKLLALGFWLANLIDAIREGDASWLIITRDPIKVESPQAPLESEPLLVNQNPRRRKRRAASPQHHPVIIPDSIIDASIGLS